MKDFPKKSKDLPDFEETCVSIEKFIKTRWRGIKNFKPKGWDNLRKDYIDFDGQEEYCDSGQDKKDKETFTGLNTETAGGFGLTTNVALPYVMYNDICQGRSPLQSFIGAILSYGMQKGMLYGKDKAKEDTVREMVYKMSDKISDSDLDPTEQLKVFKMLWEIEKEVI